MPPCASIIIRMRSGRWQTRALGAACRHLLHKAVIASAAAHGALCAEVAGDEFKTVLV